MVDVGDSVSCLLPRDLADPSLSLDYLPTLVARYRLPFTRNTVI